MKEPNTNSDKLTLLLEDLMDGLQTDGKYEHLQIILSKNNNRTIGREYLVVSPFEFGVYQLLNIDYQEGHIQLTLRNTETDNIVEEHLDINDTKLQLLLVGWDDIKRMVYKTKTSELRNDDDLLEFNF